MENDVVVNPQQIVAQVKSDLYGRIRLWELDFGSKSRREPPESSLHRYYADAASGLAIALQEIDRERYDREKSACAFEDGCHFRDRAPDEKIEWECLDGGSGVYVRKHET